MKKLAKETTGATPEKNEKKKIPLITVDLSGAWDKESAAELILKQLKKRKLYKTNLLYSGFDGDKPRNVLETTHFFATDEEGLSTGGISDVLDGRYSALAYAEEYEKPGLVIYDKDKIEQDLGELIDYEIEINDKQELREAIVAVLLLNNYGTKF